MNPTGRSIIGNCSFCGGMVRIKFDIEPSTDVRCPHCKNTTKLSSLIETAVPELEIVESEPIEPETKQRTINGKLDVSPVLSRGAMRKRKRRSGSSSRHSERISRPANPPVGSSRNGESSGSSSSSSKDDPKSSTSRSSRNSKSRSSSSSRQSRTSSFKERSNPEIFKVVAGAFLAIPVAQLLVWWLVGVDPARLGPSVSKVIPVVVPEQFRSTDKSGESKRSKQKQLNSTEQESTRDMSELMESDDVTNPGSSETAE